VRISQMVPEPIKAVLRPFVHLITRPTKYKCELRYWREFRESSGGRFDNSHYRQVMLSIAGEKNEEFVKGKVLADFGCGPCGSLAWAKQAALRIGLDVLADQYADAFKSEILTHNMIYVTTTEEAIPLPNEIVDVMFTMNAIDHVDKLTSMSKEIWRVLKPGGDLIASFNLGEPPSFTEPQVLSEASLKQNLLQNMNVISYRIAPRGPDIDRYGPMLRGASGYGENGMAILWVRAMKPVH